MFTNLLLQHLEATMKQQYLFFIKRSSGQWISQCKPRSKKATDELLNKHPPIYWERIQVLADNPEDAQKKAVSIIDRQNRLTKSQRELLDLIFASLRPSIKVNMHDAEALEKYVKLHPSQVKTANGLINRGILRLPFPDDPSRVSLTIMGLNQHPLLPKTPARALHGFRNCADPNP